MACKSLSTEYQSVGRPMEAMESGHLTPDSRSASITAGRFARSCPACTRIAEQSRFRSHIFYLYPEVLPASEKDKCSVARSIRSKGRTSIISINSYAIVSKKSFLKTIARWYNSMLEKLLRTDLARFWWSKRSIW